MITRRIRLLKRIAREQAGQVFIMVLLLMLLGALVIPPLLSFTSTGTKSGQIYEQKANELYAADAGIEDGIWQIKYDEMASFPSYGPYAYYEHSPSYSWGYDLSDEPGEVNDQDVHVTIENEWIPKGITAPSESEANAIIETGNLMVIGGLSDANTYRIRVLYTKIEMADDGPPLTQIGVWLPPGFGYVEGSSNLEQLYPSDPGHPDSVVVTNPYKGGEAVEWNFNGDLMKDFPPGTQGDQPIIREVTFQYTGPSEGPNALSWVRTGTHPYLAHNYSWDGDVRIFKIISTAGDTTLESYTARTELRHLSSAIAGDYYATGNSLLTTTSNPSYRDRLYEKSTATVAQDAIPPSAQIGAAYLYWSGWIDWHNYDPPSGGDTTVFSENCNNFYSPPVNWSAGSRWTIYNNDEFRVQGGGTQSQMTLNMSQSLNLSAYSSKTVTISWSQRKTGTLEDSDYLYFAFSSDGGNNWSQNYEAFHGNNPSATFGPYTIPDQYLTSGFRMRFYSTLNSYDEYAYVNNITITASSAIFSENCADFTSPPVTWSYSADWTLSSGAYRGHYNGGNRYLTMDSSLDLSTYTGKKVTITWQQWENGYLEDTDRLYFAFSGNGGSSWSSDIEAFRDDIGSSPVSFSYQIPDGYLTNNFRMRLYLSSFSDSDEYCFVDNIVIAQDFGSLEYPDDPTSQNLTTLVEDTARVNKVIFNNVQVTADLWQVLPTADDAQHNYQGTWSYNCFYDATDLVKQWIANKTVAANGTGAYTLGHVVAPNEEDPGFSFNLYPSGATGYPLGTPAYLVGGSYPTRHNYCYCGWSLILIYSSPDTKGHQLYLYDIQNPDFSFFEAWHNDPDFDGDGHPGGSISGFLAPDDIVNEGEAAHLTVFAGEGDSNISGDYIRVNGTNLSNSASPVGNVWNSASPGLSISGVDIDTFTVQYPTIQPEDTQADINLPTDSDGFVIVYIILSFRSSTTTGGTLGYLIRN